MRLPKSSIVLLSKSVTDLHCLSTITAEALDLTPVFAKKKPVGCFTYSRRPGPRTPYFNVGVCWEGCVLQGQAFFSHAETLTITPQH